ncbi:hypothetical protein HOY80DRAFT_982763 [Tuber brumale]|nr:hypothetical protein HOY80DRAFT_982763 [Tuber brumale]
MDSPAQATLSLSPKKQFLAIFGPASSLMRPCDGGDGSEDEEEEGEEDEYEDEDEEGNSSFRSSNSSSLGTKLSLLESIVEEEDSSLAGGETERVYPLIESSPEESRNEGYFARAFSEQGESLVPFASPLESGAEFAGVIDSDTDHFSRPRAASRPNTPDGSQKIEFTAAQPGCIDCIIGIAGHHHGSSSRTTPTPTPTLSRSSSLKLKEPPLTPVEEESPQGIIERRERAEVIEATTAKLTNLTTLTPETTPLKSSSYFVQQQLTNGLSTPETTPLRYTAPQRQPQVLNETNSTDSNDPVSPIITPARRSGGVQIPPTPPTTPARRKSLLYSRENSRESVSTTGTSTSTSSKYAAPTGTITPPSEAAPAIEAEETKIEERKFEEEKPKTEAPKTEKPDKVADSESKHGHEHDGHDCPFLRRSASPRPSSSHSYSYSYSVSSTPEPVRPHSYSSPEAPPFTTHFHSGPSTPAPPVSRLSYSLPGTPEVSSSLSYTGLPPKAPEVSRLISQEFASPSTPEVVFSGSGTASPFMDVSEPASRAPSPPPPSLAGGSAITTPASSIFLPARGALAPAINLKDNSGIKSVSRSVSTSDFFPEQTSTTAPPAPSASAPAAPTTQEPEKQVSNLLPENITVEVIHRLPFLALPTISPTRIARSVTGPVQFASNAIIVMWLAVLPFLTLLIWTMNGIAQLFVKPEVGSPMARFNPAWALVPYLVLFAIVGLYHRRGGLKGGEGGSEGGEGAEEINRDFLDYFLGKLYAVAAQFRRHFTPRRTRRFTISLLFAASLIGGYFALQYLAPHITALAEALSSRIFSSKDAPPAPTTPTSGPWEDMDFMYFVPSTSTSEQSTSSGMENAYGEYHPGANALEEVEEGLGWKGVLRFAAVLVMGPAGAVAVRRRTL